MNAFDYQMGMSDYLSILKRRKLHFIMPFILVLGMAAGLAFLLPAVYRSEATLIVEQQRIPENMIATTVTGYAQEQIQSIFQRIVTPENLQDIALRHHLYPQEMSEDPISVVALIRENINVDMVEVNLTEAGGRRSATIAFTVAYNAETPESARAVTEELAQLYLEVNKSSRIAGSKNVFEFLEIETEKQRAELSRLEKLLADFKQEEMLQLPELMATNLRLSERTELSIDQTEERIRGFSDRIDALKAEISLTPPYETVKDENGKIILTASERLALLTATYLRDSARYSIEHPDIIRMTREIRILAEQTGALGRVDEIMNELVRLQESLRQARQQYSENHPEVKKLEIAVAAMQRGFQTVIITGEGESDKLTTPPDNPRYVALKSQLNSMESNITAERKKLEAYNQKYLEYQARLFQTPIVERNFKSLSRDYANALSKFAELKEKQSQAELAETLELGDYAAGFELASNAYLPVLPDSPNRVGILILGTMFAFVAGLGLVVIVEYLDKTIRNSRIIARTLGAPPLVVIPQMCSIQRSWRILTKLLQDR